MLSAEAIHAFQDDVFHLEKPVRLSLEEWKGLEQYLTNLYTKIKTGKVVQSGETRTDSYACTKGRRQGSQLSKGTGSRNRSR